MKGFLLDEKQRDELALLNARQADRQLVPVPLKDGRWAIAADVSEDGYWAGWQEFIKGLGESVEIVPGDCLCAASIEDADAIQAMVEAYQAEQVRMEAARGLKSQNGAD